MVYKVIGLAVIDGSGAQPATDYAQALQTALTNHNPSRTSAVFLPNDSIPNNFSRNVAIRVRDTGKNPNNGNSGYAAMANKFFGNGANQDDAVIVVAADAIAATHMRKKATSGGNAGQKAVITSVSADPEYFAHCSSKKTPDQYTTGVLVVHPALSKGRLQALKTLYPAAQNVGIIRVRAAVDSNGADRINHCADLEQGALEGAAFELGLNIAAVAGIAPSLNNPDLSPITNANASVDSWVIIRDPTFQYNRNTFVPFVNGTNKPAVYPYRSFVEAGGLLSHGPDLVANMAAAGEMVAQVLDRVDQGLTTDVSGIPFLPPPSIETVIKQSTYDDLVNNQGLVLAADISWAVVIP